MCQLLCCQTTEKHSYQFCVEKGFTPALLPTWWICGPRSGLNRTHTFSKLGSRALKGATRSKAPRSHLGPPKISRQVEWQMTCSTAHSSSLSLQAENSCKFKIWSKVTFHIKEALCYSSSKTKQNKTHPQHPLPQPTYLCIFRYDLPFRYDLCFISNCLLFLIRGPRPGPIWEIRISQEEL